MTEKKFLLLVFCGLQVTQAGIVFYETKNILTPAWILVNTLFIAFYSVQIFGAWEE